MEADCSGSSAGAGSPQSVLPAMEAVALEALPRHCSEVEVLQNSGLAGSGPLSDLERRKTTVSSPSDSDRRGTTVGLLSDSERRRTSVAVELPEAGQRGSDPVGGFHWSCNCC